MNNSNKANNPNNRKVVTEEIRLSFCRVFEPVSINGGKPKYSVSLIIPKSDTATIEAIKNAIQAAYEEGESKLRGNSRNAPPLSSIKTPLRDGDLDRPDDPSYVNSFYINAKSPYAPVILNSGCEPITNKEEIYSGAYAKASITMYAYNANCNRGIACGLNGIQKTRDGTPLGGRTSAKDDFSKATNDFLI